jgi:uncharacterized membrane protein YfcA
MPIAMRMRTFLQLLTVFLCGALLGVLILVLHLPRWLEEALGFIVTTITIAAMWALRARSQTPSRKVASTMSDEAPSTESNDRMG